MSASEGEDDSILKILKHMFSLSKTRVPKHFRCFSQEMEGLIFGPFFGGIFFSKYQVEAFQVSSHLLGFGGLLSLLSRRC